MKRIIFLMLTLLLAVGIAKAADPVKYIERSWDDVNKKVVATEKTCDNYTLLTGNPSHWEGLGDGWYVVKDANVSYQTLNILGNAHLILCDGARISLTGGVKLEGSHTLTVYGQTGDDDGEGSGELSAHNTDYDNTAGIGSAENTTCGNLVVHGGHVYCEGNENAAGIGGGKGAHSGNVTIYGGHVLASGGDNAAGIGGGAGKGIGGTVSIYGGQIRAWGGVYGASIGGGDEGDQNGVVNIYGGYVDAYGKYDGDWLAGGGAGIGGGDEGSGGTVNISGGTVHAYGRGFAAGIGGGQNRGISGTVTISGGNVHAYGYDPSITFSKDSGAGIGGGNGGGQGGDVIITGGYVEARGGIKAAGIGGGSYSGGGAQGGKVKIMGGKVIAVCGKECKPSEVDGGSAIGCGKGPNKDNNSGNLEFGKQMMVIVNGQKMVYTERENKCRYSESVQIELCDHENCIIIINDGFTHTPRRCTYCDDIGNAENHVFGSDGKCYCGLLGLKDDASNTALINQWDGQTTSVALIGRTFHRDAKWNTLCLPFGIENIAEDSPLKNATIKTLTGATFDKTTGTLTLKFSDSYITKINAGWPYLVCWEGQHNAGLEDLKNPLFRDVKIDNSKGIIPMPERLNSNVSFIGVYDPLVIAKSGDKSKFYVGDDNTLRYPEMSFNINPFRAYLQLNDGLRTSANGDVNGDKEINVLDITELVDYILGNASSEFIVDNADVTEEGEVDVNDVTAVVDTILKGNNKVLKVVINLSDINSHTNLTQGDGGSGPAQ